jgi:polysaccharide biosynthesis transport protein
VEDIVEARQASTAERDSPGLVGAVWQQRWVVLGCLLVAALAGALVSQAQSPRYTAQSRVFLSAQGDFDPLDRSGGGDAGRFAENQLALMGSTPVLAATIKSLHLAADPRELARDVTLSAADGSTVITVRASAADPGTAVQIADGIPAAYRAYVKGTVANRAGGAAEATKDAATLASIRTAEAVYGDGVGSVEPATRPTSPSRPQPVRDGLVLGLLGLLVGAGYALWTQSASRRRVGPGEASAAFAAPVLGEIPDRGRILAADLIAPAYSEPGDAYRMAAVALDYIRGDAPGVFLVTAPHDGAGSSLTALNLAAAAADHGRKVFLFNVEDTVRQASDLDVGGPRIPLHELAQGWVDLGHVVERRASRARFGIIRLQVQHPLQGHPVADVQNILEQLPDDTDLVLIDAPPLPSSSASFVLAGQVDAAVVVVDEGTTAADLEELNRRCRLAGIGVAGVLMNHIRPRPGEGPRRRRREVALGAESAISRSQETLPAAASASDLVEGWGPRPDLAVMAALTAPAAASAAPASMEPAGSMGSIGSDQTGGSVAVASVALASAAGTSVPADEISVSTGYGIAPDPASGGASQAPWSSVTRVSPGWEASDG